MQNEGDVMLWKTRLNNTVILILKKAVMKIVVHKEIAGLKKILFQKSSCKSDKILAYNISAAYEESNFKYALHSNTQNIFKMLQKENFKYIICTYIICIQMSLLNACIYKSKSISERTPFGFPLL